MLETIVGGLAVTAATALAWLAAKRPQAYRRLFGPLTAAWLIAFVGLFVWSEALSRTFQTLAPYLGNEDSASRALESLRVSGWVCIALLVALLYVMLLLGLPRLFEKREAGSVSSPHDDE